VEESEEPVEVDLFFEKAAAVSPILNIPFVIHSSYVAEDILVTFTGISAVAVWYDRVHSELGVFTFFN
jgi:hypothetical protein